MLTRCYGENSAEYVRYGGVGVRVDEEWHNFQNYADWYFSFGAPLSWTVDKDIVEVGGTKEYSVEKCSIVPPYINNSIVHQKHTTNGYPIGVWYSSFGCVSKFTAELGKQNLGWYGTAEEAHRAWQLAKADQLEKTVTKYKGEPLVFDKVVDGLLDRVALLREDAARYVITKTL